MPAAERRGVCISVHDVAPATWPSCARLLEMLDACGGAPVTLLVVPDYHRSGRIDAHPDFLRAIERRLARGDEIAVHGYTHLDESPPPRAPIGWLQRRVLTQSEGEFAALPAPEALKRLEQGEALMRALGWPAQGFVAPAWLLGKGARAALAQTGYAYTTTRGGLYRLPDWQYTRSPSLVYTVRKPWRRAMSLALNRATLALARRGPLLRLALHPADAAFDDVVAQWRGFVEAALRTHVALTKREWLLERQAPRLLQQPSA